MGKPALRRSADASGDAWSSSTPASPASRSMSRTSSFCARRTTMPSLRIAAKLRHTVSLARPSASAICGCIKGKVMRGALACRVQLVRPHEQLDQQICDAFARRSTPDIRQMLERARFGAGKKFDEAQGENRHLLQQLAQIVAGESAERAGSQGFQAVRHHAAAGQSQRHCRAVRNPEFVAARPPGSDGGKPSRRAAGRCSDSRRPGSKGNCRP